MIRRISHGFARTALTGALTLAFAGGAWGQALLQVYRDAQANDPTFAASRATYRANLERVPQALQDAFERLRLDGVGVVPVSDVHEAVSRFEAGSMIVMIGDGIVPPAELVAQLAEDGEPVVVTVRDDEAHQAFERIDGHARWAGVALVDAHLLGSTAAMLSRSQSRQFACSARFGGRFRPCASRGRQSTAFVRNTSSRRSPATARRAS